MISVTMILMVSLSRSKAVVDPSDEADWDEYEEDDEEVEQVQCLLCDQIDGNVSDSLNHCKKVHGFDLLCLRKEAKLDFYQTIRFVNYIRTEVAAGSKAQFDGSYRLDEMAVFLKDDALLKPFLEDDALLFGLDDEALEPEAQEDATSLLPPALSEGTPDQQLAHLRLYAIRLQQELSTMSQQFQDFQSQVQSDFLASVGVDSSAIAETSAPAKVDNDTHYFDSYSYSDIHETMLKDTVRTESYRDFIYHNKDIFRDKLVLDVGCGTGILSMFAAKAGAKHVYAVDNSNVITKATQNIIDNGLASRITLVRGKVEDIQLPVDKVDIIISEWMGYFLLYEAMLDSVLHARDRFLGPGGILAPSQTQILIAAFRDENLINDSIDFWSDVYGFKMTSMREELYQEALIDVIPKESVVSNAVVIKDLALNSVTSKELDFRSAFEVMVASDGPIHGFVGWFDTVFSRDGEAIPVPDSDKSIGNFSTDKLTRFTTGPHDKSTHWKQTLFLLKEPIEAKRGTRIQGEFHCTKNADNERELDIEIHFGIDAGAQQVAMYRVR